MRFTWTLFAVLAAVAAVQVQATHLEDVVRQNIEEFRSIMKTGSEELGVPVLEPVTIPQIPISVKASPLNAKVVASNIQVAGASGVEVTQLSQVGDSNQVSVAVEVPSIDVTGQYDIDGKVKIGFINFKLTGNGPLTATLRGLKGNGVADVQLNDDGSMNVNKIKINSWSYDKLQINLSNLMGGGVVGKTVNSLINKLAPTFINSNKAKINQLAETVGKEFINKYLARKGGNKLWYRYQSPVVPTLEWTVTDEVEKILEQIATVLVDGVQEDTPDATSTPLEDQVTTFLTSFRDVMKTGRPDFHIPVLDPAVVDKLPIDVKRGPFQATIIATESEITGVSGFELTEVSQIDGTNKVNVAIEVPEVNINGKFDMFGKVKILGFSRSINDHGPLSLNVNGIKLDATVDVQANDDGSYTVQEINVNAWNYADIEIQLDNLLGGGTVGKLANRAFNEVFPALVESDRSKINNWLEIMSQNLINKYLDGLAGKETANLEAELRETSEYLRTAMKTGRKDLNLPVLDPLVMNDLPVHLQRWPLDAKIDTTNIHITGLADFKLNQITQIVGTDQVYVDFEIPTVSIDCNYDLKSILEMAFIKLNFNNQGPLKLHLSGLKGVARAQLYEDTDGFLAQSGLQIESWSYDSLEVEVADWAGSGFIKKTLNTLVNKLVPVLFIKPHTDELGAWAAGRIQGVIGRFLDAAAGRVVVSNLDARASELLEELKTVLKTGSVAYNMPALDPAFIANLPVAFKRSVINADILAREVSVAGASGYTVTKLVQREGSNRLDVEVEASDIVADAKFDINGTVGAGVISKSFTDNGLVTVTIKGLKAAAIAEMASQIDGSLVLRNLQITSWTYDSIHAEFSDLHSGQIVTDALNKGINFVLEALIKLKHDDLAEWGRDTAKIVLDQFLSGVAATQSATAVVRVFDIPSEAMSIIKELAILAVRSGVAQAA